MTRTIKVLFLIFIVALFSACTDDEVTTSENFVLEGFIVAGTPVNDIKVKGVSPLNSDEVTSEPLSNAVIVLTHQGSFFDLTFNEATGLYRYDGEDLNIDIGEEYAIEVTVDNRTATASTLVPTKPTGLSLPDSVLQIPTLRLSFTLGDEINDLFFNERITLTWDEAPGQSFYVVIETLETELDPILPPEIPEEAVELLSSFRFISEPSETGQFEIIGVALETYGRHVAKVFTVNQEYVDLFENAEQDSRDLNEPPSNVFNALGIFTSFAVDSVTFDVLR